MNIEETKQIINYLLDNNLELVKKGQNKISIGLEGAPGIGKTAIIKEIAEERGAKFIRVELGSLEEIGDLVGMPVKEYNILKNGKEIWIAEKLLLEYINMGWKLCEECTPRMSYAIPAWVPNDPDQEVILLLDDYTRATSLFMQAIMSLIQFGEYISWSLPKKTHLLLTSNEDTGDMSVTSLDSAQSSRLLNFHLDFDYKQYGAWMDKNNLKSEAINFMLLTPEIFTASDRVNARTYTMFTNAISGFNKLNDPDVLNQIDYIAKGCFGKDTTIGELFTTFVYNNLDKLITAEQMLGNDWDKVKEKIRDNVNKNGQYRADIASILTMRLINFIENTKDPKTIDKAIARIEDIVNCSEVLLTEDLIFNLIRKLNKSYRVKCQKLILNPKVRTKIL